MRPFLCARRRKRDRPRRVDTPHAVPYDSPIFRRSSSPPTIKGGSMSQPHNPMVSAGASAVGTRIEQSFEIIVFASRWVQAPLYGGLIVAELLYAYKFLTELWEMIHHLGDSSETIFMLGVLSLIDITMVANLLT